MYIYVCIYIYMSVDMNLMVGNVTQDKNGIMTIVSKRVKNQ